MTQRKRTFGWGEVIFDLAYLSMVAVMGAVLLLTAHTQWRTLYGLLALVLVCGDAFHLVPRICAALGLERMGSERLLGLGKQITSIGMTGFYLLLWQVGTLYLPVGAGWRLWGTGVALALGLARIVLCLLPQNSWGAQGNGGNWDLWRNLPFLLLGAQVGALYFVHRAWAGPFSLMWVAIGLSFLFYLPVVVWGRKRPMLGMLMLPKSCAYLWIVAMGL